DSPSAGYRATCATLMPGDEFTVRSGERGSGTRFAQHSAKELSTMPATKKQTKTKRAPRRVSSKRELIKPNGDARYIRRDAKGRIKESDDMGKSLKADRRTK